MPYLSDDDSAPPLSWSRAPISKPASQAVEFLFLELETSEQRKRALRKDDRERLMATMSAMSLELYAAQRDGGIGWRRYSRTNGAYQQRNRYSAWAVTATTVSKVADWLMAAGYAEGKMGHYRRYPEFGENVGAGKQSRIRATAKLISHFEEDFRLSPRDIGFASWLEPIVLRDRRDEDTGIKRDIDYEDTPETYRMRANLRRINAFLAEYRISLAKPSEPVFDLPPSMLRRIFSRGSFGLGGRFYGGLWIDLPSEERPNLLIDGEEVAELDFSALHPRLIYQLEGKPLPPQADPYAVPNWIGSEQRGWVKIAFQQLINADANVRLRKPSDVPASQVGKGGWPKLIRALKEHHHEIAGWFHSGTGLELQRIDSDIAEAIMLSLASEGICCLPVHDSFIVPQSHTNELREAMVQAYHSVLAGRGVGAIDPIIHMR